MAEHLVRHALNSKDGPLKILKTDSFGLSAFPGSSASENSVFALSKVGLDLSSHISKSVDQVNLSDAAAFFCMTDSHRDMLLRFHGTDLEKTHLMRDWVEGNQKNIPDPFGGGVDEYLECRDAMVEAIPGLIAYLENELNS
ncbi:MAG: low molecular weight protein arginine phosphatase [Opitutales bacterium]|nr:low molecular weight protein arginine phosphatase [Opitutales bacterium]